MSATNNISGRDAWLSSMKGLIEDVAPDFENPVTRLRFLRSTLARVEQCQTRLRRAFRHTPFLVNTRFYRWLLRLNVQREIYEVLETQLALDSPERRRLLKLAQPSPAGRIFLRLPRQQAFIPALIITLVLAVTLSVYALVGRPVQSVKSGLAVRAEAPSVRAQPRPVSVLTESTNYLPDYQPEKVWLVERKDDYERYSNGLRVVTNYQISTRPRSYDVIERGLEKIDQQIRHQPVGILYHTSESDLLAFGVENNRSIEALSAGLLQYVQRNKSYNYVIDRFGQVHRVVRDSDVANHAGHSVWADERGVYLELSESFIGVCFETRSETTAPDEQLTEAQLIAGRLLTAVLRSRYNIADANCVTHGLVSVNPTSMLIAYHYDWLRGFPFEAMGISDKYRVAPASISECGFTYDDLTLSRIGGFLSPGIEAAEEELTQRARQTDQTTEEFRRILRDRYLSHFARVRKMRFALSEDKLIDNPLQLTEKRRNDGREKSDH